VSGGHIHILWTHSTTGWTGLQINASTGLVQLCVHQDSCLVSDDSVQYIDNGTACISWGTTVYATGHKCFTMAATDMSTSTTCLLFTISKFTDSPSSINLFSPSCQKSQKISSITDCWAKTPDQCRQFFELLCMHLMMSGLLVCIYRSKPLVWFLMLLCMTFKFSQCNRLPRFQHVSRTTVADQ